MESTLETLKKMRKTARLALVGQIALIALAAVLMLVCNTQVSICALAVAVAYYWAVLRRLVKQYTQALSVHNDLQTLGKALGTDHLDENGGGLITPEDVDAAQLLPRKDSKDSCLLRQGLSGTLNKMPVAVCDATLTQELQNRKPHFTTGAWIRFTLPRDTGMDWRLLDPQVMPKSIRQTYYQAQPQLTLQETENEDSLLLYTSAGNRAAPGERILNKVHELVKYTPGKVAISVRGDTMWVFLSKRFVSMVFNMKEPPDGQELKINPLPELEYAAKIAVEVYRQE